MYGVVFLGGQMFAIRSTVDPSNVFVAMVTRFFQRHVVICASVRLLDSRRTFKTAKPSSVQ